MMAEIIDIECRIDPSRTYYCRIALLRISHDAEAELMVARSERMERNARNTCHCGMMSRVYDSLRTYDLLTRTVSDADTCKSSFTVSQYIRDKAAINKFDSTEYQLIFQRAFDMERIRSHSTREYFPEKHRFAVTLSRPISE